MAEEDLDALEGDAPMAPEDNALALTSGLVITTFGLGLLAFIMLQKAMANWYGVGMFA